MSGESNTVAIFYRTINSLYEGIRDEEVKEELVIGLVRMALKSPLI